MPSPDAAQALLVVDVQRGWVSGPHAVQGAADLVDRLVDAADAARGAGALVIQLQDVGDADSSVLPGSSGRELVLPVGDGDLVVAKEVDDGFVGTGLEAALRAAGVVSVVVGGLQSEMCVAATARGALARGFAVVLPRDLHATREIPADDGQPAVPARQVSRVAEWSLGDELAVVDSVVAVAFGPPGG